MPDPYSNREPLTLIKIYKSNVVTSAKSINCHVNYQNVNVALKYECSLLTVHLWSPPPPTAGMCPKNCKV